MKINVNNILNSVNASLHNDGILVYNEIKKQFDAAPNNTKIEVDFSEIKRCSTLFLNACFGNLLKTYGVKPVSEFIHHIGYTNILNFEYKYDDMLDNFINKDNYQAYREEAFA